MARPPKNSVACERTMLRLHEQGWSYKRIAREYGLTDRGVASIVARGIAQGASGWWRAGSASSTDLSDVIEQAKVAADPEGRFQVKAEAFVEWLRAGRNAGYLDVLFKLGEVRR